MIEWVTCLENNKYYLAKKTVMDTCKRLVVLDLNESILSYTHVKDICYPTTYGGHIGG
jgi:hypothetical protein